jgi:hypothetical protein
MRCQPDRDRAWRSWLVTTAQREAWRLHATEAAHIGFELPGKENLLGDAVDPRDTLELRSELRAALDLLAAVPERRREAKALQITGFTYDEIGDRLGIGHTRVNALVAEANAAIRREHRRVAPEQQPRSARAARLHELEEQPPRWLTSAIGAPPGKSVPSGALLAWRRAALAIDDYRRDHGHNLGDEGLGQRPADPHAARAYELAAHAATRAREAREATRQRSRER